jgi:hypothetical protein
VAAYSFTEWILYSREIENIPVQWIALVLPLGVNQPLASNSREVKKAWTLLSTSIRFQGVMQRTTFICAPTNICLDYTRNTSVGEVTTATRVQPPSYFEMHLGTSLSYVLFYPFAFQFLASSFVLRFPLSNTMHFIYSISFPTLYSQFLLFLRSFRFEVHTS